MRANPLTDTVSPVSVQELQAYLDVDSDAMLEDMLSVATDAAIAYLNVDLLPRQWKYTENAHKYKVSVQYKPHTYKDHISLPYTALISVESVEVDGEAVDFTVDTESRPGRVYVNALGDQTVINYTAGNARVPATIRTGIKMLASFLYEHAGACDVTMALHKSGAEAVLRPYRVEA